MMIRAILTACVEGVIKRLSGAGLICIEDREYFQHYGFTSRPRPGAEVILVADGNHIVAIASDDRRYRLAVAEGEVALYTDEGDKVHLKRDRQIEVVAGASVTVTSPLVQVVASTKVLLDTPLVDITGSIYCRGDITAVGDIADANGTKSMGNMRTTYNSHVHADPQGGATSQTGQVM